MLIWKTEPFLITTVIETDIDTKETDKYVVCASGTNTYENKAG